MIPADMLQADVPEEPESDLAEPEQEDSERCETCEYFSREQEGEYKECKRFGGEESIPMKGVEGDWPPAFIDVNDTAKDADPHLYVMPDFVCAAYEPIQEEASEEDQEYASNQPTTDQIRQILMGLMAAHGRR